MRGPARKIRLGGLAVVLMLAVSACGNADTRVTTGTYAGESGASAPYLNVGPLEYQVQISRALNPFLVEEEPNFEGIPSAQRSPAPGEEWLGVFMQVYNHTHRSHKATSDIVIYDTQGNTYHPIELPATNLMAYRPVNVPADGGQLPALGTIAYEGPTQGALLLFKIKLASLDNRPIKIKILDQESGESATATLDI